MADRYWVGGAGTWDATSTTNWSDTSGGGGGASVPTTADNVFFDSASNPSSYAVTVSPTFVGTGSCSPISSMTTVFTVATVTSGTVAVGDIISLSSSSFIFKITSFGTGSGGAGTYNCSVLYGQNGYSFSTQVINASRQECANINIAGPASGTLSWTTTTASRVQVAGSITTSSTGANAPSFNIVATGSATHTITSNGLSLTSSITYLSGTGTYSLGGALTTSSFFVSTGTFNTANFALTVGNFDQISSGTRTINLGSSTVNITNSSYPLGTAWGSGVTFNAGTSTVNFTCEFAFSLPLGSKTWYNVAFTSTNIANIYGIPIGSSGETNTFNNLSIAGQSSTGIAFIWIEATSTTINGTFTIGAAANPSCRLSLKTGNWSSTTAGTTKTITAAAFAAGATDVDWQDITIAGAAGTISGTRFGNCGGCTNITFDTAKTVYWNLSGAQNWSATGWATSSGGTPAAANFPLAQDTAVFDNTGSVTGTITVNFRWNIGSIDMSGRTSAMTLATSTNTPTVYGSWTNGSGTTLSGTGAIIFSNRSIKTINSAGKTFSQPITINAPGGGLQLVTNNLTSSGTFTHIRGTLDLNNLSFTCTTMINSTFNSTTAIAFGTTGAINLTGSGTNIIDLRYSIFTFTGTSQINCTYSGSMGTRTIACAFGANSPSINVTAGSDIVALVPNDSNNFGTLNFTGFTGSITNTASATQIHGSLTLGTGSTVSGWTSTTTFIAASGSPSITTNGVTVAFPIVINNTLTSTTQSIVGALTSTSTFTISGSSRFNFGSGTITLPSLTLSTTNLLAYGGSIILNGSGTALNVTAYSGATSTSGSPSISFTSASTKTAIFPSTGAFSNVVLNQSGAGALTLNTTTGTGTIQLPGGITNTVSPTSILVTAGLTLLADAVFSGTAGNLVTFGSASAATFTLQAITSGTKESTYCSVSYCTGNTTASGGGAVVWRFLNSTNGGNNTNIFFPVVYYWVSGSGTWDSTTTTNWSLTSGGAGAQGPPTANDDVIFDTSSNATAYTVTMGTGAVCFNMTMAGPTTGQLTWAGTTTMSIYGSMTLSGTAANGGINITYSPTSPGIAFRATAPDYTITTNGVSLPRVSLLGVGGGWTLGSALTTGYLTHSAGTFDTAGYAVNTIQYSSSGTTVRTLTLGATTWTAAGATGSLWTITGSNYSLNSGTSTINITGAATLTNFGNLTYYNVVFNYDNLGGFTYSMAITDTGTNTFRSFTVAPSSVTPNINQLVLSGNITTTTSLSLNFGGTYDNRLFVRSDTIGTQRNINWTSSSAIAYCDLRDINVPAGTGTATVGNCGGNTNVTGATPKTVYWNLAGAQNWSAIGWATSSGGTPAAANFPLAQDTVVFDDTGSVTGTISIDKAWNIGSIDMSGRTSAMTLATSTNTPIMYGSWTNGTGTTLTGTGTLTFSNRSIKTINSAGKTFTQPITIDAPGGGLQLVTNNLTVGDTQTTTLTRGTLDLNSLSLTTGIFDSNYGLTRSILFGTGSITCNLNGGGSFCLMNNLTNFTYTGTSNMIIQGSGSSTCDVYSGSAAGATSTNVLSFTFTNGGSVMFRGSYGNVTFSSFTGSLQTGSYTTIIYGNLTLASGMTVSDFTGILGFAATSGTKTITTAGRTIAFGMIFDGVGGTWQLQDALTSTSTITLTKGTLDLNSKNVTAASINLSGNFTRQISYGSSYITLTGSGTVFDITNTASLITSGSAPTLSTTSASPKTIIPSNRFSGGNINNGGAGALTITGGNSFNSITNTVQPTSFIFTAGAVTTFTGSSGFAVNGTAGNLVTIGSTTTSAFTFTRAISGTNTNSFCSISYCTGTTTASGGGAVVWQFTSSVNGGNNTNLTFIAAIYYWVGGSGTWDNVTTTNWSLSSGGPGAQGPPSAADQVIFDSSSNSSDYTVTIGTGASGLQATIGAPASGKVTLAGSAALTLYGYLNLTGGTAGITNSYTGDITFAGSGDFTPNGVTFASNVIISGSGISVGLGSSLTTTGSVTLTQGTLSLSTYTLTASSFSSNNSNTRTLAFGTGNITTTGSGTTFTTATVTGLTVSGTPVVNISYSGATATTVATGATTEANAISFNFTAGTYTLSFLNSSNDRCRNVNFTGFSGTWGTTSTCYIGGNLTLSSGMTLSASTSTCNFLTTSTSVTRTITSNGKTLDFPVSINYPSSSTLQLVDAMVVGATRTLTLSQGTINLNNFNLTTGIFSSNANTRAITFGTGNIVLSHATAGTTVLDMATATGFTSTGTGGFASAMAVTATFSLGSTAGSNTTSANLFLTGGSAIATLTTGSYFKTIDFTGYSGTPATTTLNLYGYVLSSGGTFTNITARMLGSGSITSNGKSIAAIDVGYGSLGAGGYTSSSISNTLVGTGVGTALLAPPSGSGSAGTPVGVGTGNADDGYWPVTPGWNISFNNTNYATMYVGTNMYVTFGGGSTAFNSLSASNPAFPKIMMQAADRSIQRMYYQLTGTTPNRVFWWRVEGATGTSGTVGSPTMVYEGYLYENDPSTIDIVTGVFTTGGITGVYSASALLLAAAGLGTATTGTRITYAAAATYPSPTTTIIDSLNVTGALTFSSGTLTTTSGNVSAASFSATTATAKTLVMGSGTWTISGSGSTAWNVTNPANLTVTPGTSTISMTSASAKTFVGAGKTWWILNQAGAGTLTITGANSFNDLTASGSGRPSSILFTAGTTNTFTNFTLSGTAGNLVTIGSDTGAATHTLSKASGTVSCSYLSISYSIATGGASWYAGSTSTNSGNNTGWLFSNPAGSYDPTRMLAFFFP